MELLQKIVLLICVSNYLPLICKSAKINTPRVLLPWFENIHVNFTFEIIEGGCYTWSLSRDDIIDLEPLYEDTWGQCSRAARVSVSKSCVPPGSVIILAEEVNTGEILRGDVDIDKISSLKVISTTWKLYLEEAPEAFEVVAYDDSGNTFSTLEGVTFTWSIENLGSNVDEDPLVTLVRWRDTDYEAPRGVAELEAAGYRAHSGLLYGQAMGECRVAVCLTDSDICTDFTLHVVASVVLTPATAMIAPEDALRYRVVRARAGRLTVQDVADTLYHIKVPATSVAVLDDTVSLVRGTKVGVTTILLMSGATEVASATLTVAEPHSIRVNLRPSNLVIRGEEFLVHSVVLDKNGHALTAGDQILIRLTVDGEANVDLLKSTENGTLTDAVAQNSGPFTITARLHSIAGKILNHKVEGQVSAVAVDPLEVIPPELFVAWTETIQEVSLKHRGGGDEPVTWSTSETPTHDALSLAPTGVATIRGVGDIGVKVQLKQHPYVKAYGRVWSAVPDYVEVSNSGVARVGRPHQLHVALTGAHPSTGELFHFHSCDCNSFAVSLLEGPEPHNVTAATWIEPSDGACCVLECVWTHRGVAAVRVSRGRAGDTARVAVRAAPALLWPRAAAALVDAALPVIAEGEALTGASSEPRVVELSARRGAPPLAHPDAQLFTFKCLKKGDARVQLSSQFQEERESVEFEAACAPHVSRMRLEPAEAAGNCSGGPKIWLRPGREVAIRVTLLDAIGRELLDERGPKVKWEIEPHHAGIEIKSPERLLVETHPDFRPVPVPHKYYQLVMADEKAIGWSGVIKASIPEATATIQAKVVAPLQVEPLKVNVAWEGDIVANIATINGGSGRYGVESGSGVSGTAESGALGVTAPAPGLYDVTVADLCLDQKQSVEVNIEEILTVEVSTARAICVGSCVPITALVQGVSRRYLSTTRRPEWRVSGHVTVKDGTLCGVKEGAGRVKVAVAGVWSQEVAVLVFPPLEIVPAKARVPPGARLQLRHQGGPPSHLASLQYRAVTGKKHVEVSPTGSLHGVALGKARIRLVATDISNMEMASAESEVEVIPISGIRVRAATQTLLVGSPSPVWIEASGLSASALAALQPPPRVTYSVRDATAARLYTTHVDDKLERSVAEGLSVRVVPLKPGLITIDVRVRNMGQIAETRSFDSSIEILAISDIRTSVEGLARTIETGDRLSLSAGATVRLKSLPTSQWEGYSNGAFDVTPAGEVNALKPGHGVIIGQHRDEKNEILRQTAIHVEVSVPHYCTAEPAGEDDETAIRLVMRNNLGRALVAPEANVSLVSPLPAQTRRAANSALGNELVITGLDSIGAFMTFEGGAGGVSVRDEVWVTGTDLRSDRVVATGSWAVCLEGVGWRAPPQVTVHAGMGVTLAVLNSDTVGKHVLRLDRAANTFTIQQLPVQKMEFLPGEWPHSFVPLSIEAAGLTSSPVLCTSEEKYMLNDVQAELPFTCRTNAPHKAAALLDIANGQLGCSIAPATKITGASEVELCAEWEVFRACTKVLLLPQIQVSTKKISLLTPPATFTINGHPQALKALKIKSSPGLKLERHAKDNEINVIVKGEVSSCGYGFVEVKSKLTAQEIRVEVEKECEVACGTLLGAIISLIKPYLSTLGMIAAIGVSYLFLHTKVQLDWPMNTTFRPEFDQTVLPRDSSPINTLAGANRRTWSRSPYAPPVTPQAPVYGDASVLPDTSFSPSSTRLHSRFHPPYPPPPLIDVNRLALLTAPNALPSDRTRSTPNALPCDRTRSTPAFGKRTRREDTVIEDNMYKFL